MKTNYPDSLTIQQYLEGRLDPDVMHQLEKQAQEDPFLWDALEGYSTYKDPADDLSILQRQLHERIIHLQENKKVFDLSWQRLSVAAAAAVMFVSAGILFWMSSPKPDDRLASQTHKPVEVSVIDRDSVNAVIEAKEGAVVASSGKADAVSAKPTAYEQANAAKQSVAAEMEPAARTMSAVSDPVGYQRVNKGHIPDDTAVLNEVVAAGPSSQPKSGWQAYQEYLIVNAKTFKAEPVLQGSVLLSFEIGPTGKPLNVKVVRGLNSAYDREAIRIVKEGSEWLPSPDGKIVEQLITVNFGL